MNSRNDAATQWGPAYMSPTFSLLRQRIIEKKKRDFLKLCARSIYYREPKRWNITLNAVALKVEDDEPVPGEQEIIHLHENSSNFVEAHGKNNDPAHHGLSIMHIAEIEVGKTISSAYYEQTTTPNPNHKKVKRTAIAG